MSARIVAITGSYRKGGTVESAVDAVLEGARAKGAVTQTIRLSEHPFEFCTNCRQCTQAPGEARVKCAQADGLEQILSAIDAADAVVLGSPVNFFNATAIFRRFQERLLGYVYWPWGEKGPALRTMKRHRKAVLVASAGMPGFLIPVTTGTARALRITARVLGAKPIGNLWIGLSAGEPHHALSPRTIRRARRLGMKLA
jgi:multimeric flavodoxin WrbA